MVISETPDGGAQATPMEPPGKNTVMRPRVKQVVLVVVALLAVAAVVQIVLTVRQPGPDEVVRQFLTALQQRQVGKALSLVKATDRPSGEAARFLVADAVSTDWRIARLEMRNRPDWGDRSAYVEVWLASGHRAVDGQFRLSRTGEGWQVVDPFITFRLPVTPLWYFDVNGMKVPNEVNDRSAVQPQYALFPGVYRFYQDTSDLVDVTSEPVTLLPGGRASSFPEITVTATAEAVPLVQQAVNAHIDGCAKRTTTENVGCPFGIDLYDDSVRVRDAAGGETYVRQIADVRWRVLRYPTIALQTVLDAFTITASTTGLVELSGTGIGEDQRRIPVTARCVVDGSALVAGLTAGGTMSVVLPADRYGDSAPALAGEHCAVQRG